MAQIRLSPEYVYRPIQVFSLWCGISNVIKESVVSSPQLAAVGQIEFAVDNKRRLDRTKAVLPVRVSGNDGEGAYSDLVHTLDISPTGVRLGSVRRPLEVGSQIVLQYRQHRAEFRVVWTRPLGSGGEQQVGLEADVQKDFWGLETGAKARPQLAAPAPANRIQAGA